MPATRKFRHRTEEELVKLRQRFDAFASWSEIEREMRMWGLEIKYYKALWGIKT